MRKNVIVGIVIIIVIAGAYVLYVVSTGTELNEASPLDTEREVGKVIDDAFDTMDAESMAEFEKEVLAMEEDIVVMDEAMPSLPEVIGQGIFAPRAHEVEGKALVISHDGAKTLRFEDFETLNGPDLRIYLSTDLGISDAIDLGAIRATKGNVNYELDPLIDIEKYRNVLVWCRAFHVLFSYAELE